MEIIAISACLLGIACRYDGESKLYKDIEKLREKYILVPICPEIYGGLATPRPPAEIQGDRVINVHGVDLTKNYKLGAQTSLEICKLNNISKAVLKAKSPSCGKGLVYDGSFSGRLIDGDGITAKVLEEHGIRVFSEEDLNDII